MENDKKYKLRLYIAGITPQNQNMVIEFKNLLKENFDNQFNLEVVDVLKHPELAEGERILATPTIIRKCPDPIKRFILDFSSKEKMLIGMDLLKKD